MKSLRRVNLTVGQQRALEGLDRGRLNAIRKARTTGAENAIRVMDLALKDLNAEVLPAAERSESPLTWMAN